jgi:hypothetical protein
MEEGDKRRMFHHSSIHVVKDNQTGDLLPEMKWSSSSFSNWLDVDMPRHVHGG